MTAVTVWRATAPTDDSLTVADFVHRHLAFLSWRSGSRWSAKSCNDAVVGNNPVTLPHMETHDPDTRHTTQTRNAHTASTCNVVRQQRHNADTRNAHTRHRHATHTQRTHTAQRQHEDTTQTDNTDIQRLHKTQTHDAETECAHAQGPSAFLALPSGQWLGGDSTKAHSRAFRLEFDLRSHAAAFAAHSGTDVLPGGNIITAWIYVRV